ncbi:MAG: hypothetical protein U1A16_04565 [Patescibacteria group bacterium]|nr:hypothetical protein [Patescibacteria group bacterium]
MHPTQQKILALRYKGKSYNEIVKALGVAKGTVNYWLHGIVLPPLVQKKLAANIQRVTKNGFSTFNRERTRRIKEENKTFREISSKEIVPLSEKELLLVAVALYWGEGCQNAHAKNGTSSYALALSNSNPFLIALFLRFVREILHVPEKKIKAHLQIHPNIDRAQALYFWSSVTQLPAIQFCVITAVSSASKHRRPTRFLPHGTLDIRVNSRQLFMRMKGWIDGLAQQSELRLPS